MGAAYIGVGKSIIMTLTSCWKRVSDFKISRNFEITADCCVLYYMLGKQITVVQPFARKKKRGAAETRLKLSISLSYSSISLRSYRN